jgi:hypothetical protein
MLVNFDVITGPGHKPFSVLPLYGGSEYVGTAYTCALLECPGCGMVSFFKTNSRVLESMKFVSPEFEVPDVEKPKLTAKEKSDLYEQLIKEHREWFTSDD